jgi:hypothetical protein
VLVLYIILTLAQRISREPQKIHPITHCAWPKYVKIIYEIYNEHNLYGEKQKRKLKSQGKLRQISRLDPWFT